VRAGTTWNRLRAPSVLPLRRSWTLRTAGATAASMTGSGSAVFGIFRTRPLSNEPSCRWRLGYAASRVCPSDGWSTGDTRVCNNTWATREAPGMEITEVRVFQSTKTS